MSDGTHTIAHAWTPITAPEAPQTLAVPELALFAKLWARQRERLRSSGTDDVFLERLKRSWAIETGILERLYDVSEGATRMLVQHGFVASLIPHGESTIPPDELVAMLQDHADALDFTMDIIGGTRTLSVSWIKELHALITRSQRTTRAYTQFNTWIDVPLAHGVFKTRPNSPLSTAEGGVHEYCPPEHVASEMDRLVEAYHAIPAALPEVRSAWLHHAFTAIHPFQDGNGRVARVLASLDFIRAGLFPLLVERTAKDAYLNALREADKGVLAPLVSLFADIEQQVLIRALSEAEQTVTAATQLETVLAAVEARQRARAEDARSARDRLAEQMRLLAARATETLQARGKDIVRRAPTVRATVSAWKADTRHWYRAQIAHVGQQKGYRVDAAEPRVWARLELRNGGHSELVVALAFVGNPSPGAGIAIAWLDHRDRGEKLGSEPPADILVDPLLLISEEDPRSQAKRFDQWLDGAIVRGIAAWMQYL